MRTSDANPADWLAAGKSRMDSSDRLQNVEGASPAVVELLQESIERYLKGYLISHHWPLVRTHDLNRLIAEATRYDQAFVQFSQLAQSLTEQFWEQHYPGGDLTDIGSDYDALRQQAEELVALILQNVPPKR